MRRLEDKPSLPWPDWPPSTVTAANGAASEKSGAAEPPSAKPSTCLLWSPSNTILPFPASTVGSDNEANLAESPWSPSCANSSSRPIASSKLISSSLTDTLNPKLAYENPKKPKNFSKTSLRSIATLPLASESHVRVARVAQCAGKIDECLFRKRSRAYYFCFCQRGLYRGFGLGITASVSRRN